MSLGEDHNPVNILSQSILGSISEITASIVSINTERESIMQIGCYLERTSPVIMELRTSRYIPPNATEILKAIVESVNVAKLLIEACLDTGRPISDPITIIQELEGLIREIGTSLSLIPSSTFGDEEYVEIAVQSLSREMQNAHIIQNQFHESLEQKKDIKSSGKIPMVESTLVETDLYPVDVEIPFENPSSPEKFCDVEQRDSESTPKVLPEVAEYLDPIYEAFYCPLTKQIMEDPVTVSSGVTYERRAITRWLNKSRNSEELLCPITGKKLIGRDLNTNIALKTTIEAWKERNETNRIKVAKAALSIASSDVMILEALKDLHNICQRKPSTKIQVRNIGVIPLLAQCLESHDRKVKCATLELLQLLAEEDVDGKMMIAKTKAITITAKVLSSKYIEERHASLSFLEELSKSESLCERIGSVTGLILTLITMTINRSYDALSSEKAYKILKNLETSPKNIKCMAGNGFLEPLLNQLIEGSEDMQMEMGSYLGEIVLGHDNKIYVAKRASPTLIKMVHSGNTLAKKAAFKALIQISSYHPNSKTLVEAGLLQILIEEMFMRKIYNEFENSMEYSTEILANILDSGISLETLEVNSHGHTLGSSYIVYSLIQILKSSNSDKISINIINILLRLMKSSRATSVIVSVAKETDTSYTLIALINSPDEDLSIPTLKLLITLTPYMGHTIAESLCKTKGQPGSLIKYPAEVHRITENHAVSANFLAKLPSQNLPLNLTLLENDTVPTIARTIIEIQRSGTRTSRFSNFYLEGLVGILVRFTATLYHPEILYLAKKHNFTKVFTELLKRAASDEVQILSAVGLQNLSAQSLNLSKPPSQIKKASSLKFPRFLSMKSSKHRGLIQVCPVHRGVCSSQTTFCLLDAKAIERLLACLDHENVDVVRAALSAICTLLDDNVDLDKSVSVLSEVHAIRHILNVLREHKEESVLQKSFLVIEKFLKSGDKSILDIIQDRSLSTTLMTAVHQGDVNTREIAEKILRHLNKMPNFSAAF